MAKSRILLIDHESRHSVQLAPTSSILLSSTDAAWTGIHVEQQRLPPVETPEVYVPLYTINLQLKSPGLFEWQDRRGGMQKKQLVPGDVSLYIPNAPRKYRWHQDAEVLNIVMSSPLLAQVAQEAIVTGRIELVEQYGGRDPQIEHLALALKAELEAGCPGGRLYGDSLATALAVHLLRCYSVSPMQLSVPQGTLSSSQLRQIADYIHEHLDADLSLSQLAGRIGMSVYHFTRLFKRSTGLSPHQYVLHYRVEEAKRLLLAGDASLKEIARRVGFGNQSHLNRHFKRLVGASPTIFLQAHFTEKSKNRAM